jgi:hypothetical protein
MSLSFLVAKSTFMNVPKSFLGITTVVFVIGIGWLTVSCTSGPPTTRYLVDQPDRAVGMEVTYREGSPEYSHPATLTPELLDQFLQHIEVQPSSLLDRLAGGSSTRQEAFPSEQRGFLANQLSTAFNKATPLETVTFYWATPRGNGIWEFTSGGLYLQEEELHIVLPNYQQTVPAKDPLQLPKNHPLAQLGEPLHSLRALAPAQQLTHGLVTELWSPQTPHFVFSLKELANLPLLSGDQHANPSNPPLNSGKSIKQRLKNLEELQREGLLTEKEYHHKRQEILEEL